MKTTAKQLIQEGDASFVVFSFPISSRNAVLNRTALLVLNVMVGVTASVYLASCIIRKNCVPPHIPDKPLVWDDNAVSSWARI